MKKLLIAWSLFAAVVVCAMASIARAQAAGPAVLHVHFVGLPSNEGRISCIIFNSPDGFPSDASKAAGKVRAPIANEAGTCDFQNLAAGRYAVAVFQDEHETGILTKNFMGIPTEAFGFSNDAHGMFGPASFGSAIFSYPGGIADITIHAQH